MTSVPVLPQPDTPSDLFEGVTPLKPDEGPPPQASTVVSKVIYLSLAVLPGLLVLVVLLARAGIISTRPHQGKTPWDLAIMIAAAVVVVTIATLVARRAPKLYERSKSVAALDATSAKWELRMLVATLIPAAGLVTLAFLTWTGVVRVGFISATPIGPPMLGAIAVLLTCSTVGYFSYTREHNIRQLEERFPDFLRDLNESYGAGLTMAQAIRVAARGDYGALNPELKMMAHQVSWGASFTDALRMFAQRVDTPLITRAVSLIIKATAAGGSVKDVLGAAARDAREIEALEAELSRPIARLERHGAISDADLFAIEEAASGALVPSLLQSSTGVAGATTGAFALSGRLTIHDFHAIYFGVGIVQSAGSSIVAGVMSEGKVSAGLTHMAIMCAITVVVLGIVL